MTLGNEILHVNQHIIACKIEVSNIIHWIPQVHSGFSGVITVIFVWAISGSKSLSKTSGVQGNSDLSSTVAVHFVLIQI